MNIAEKRKRKSLSLPFSCNHFVEDVFLLLLNHNCLDRYLLDLLGIYMHKSFQKIKRAKESVLLFPLHFILINCQSLLPIVTIVGNYEKKGILLF